MTNSKDAAAAEQSPLDPNIPRKSGIIDHALTMATENFPLPAVVEVSESGTCNRACIFCPRSNPAYPDVKEFIKPELVEKLARQLGEAGFEGLFLFSGFVEPLLDKKIYRHIKTVRRHLPQGRIEMVTNGDPLNRSRLLKLFESGLDTLLISAYDGPEQAEDFERLCKDSGLQDDQYLVRHRYYPPDQDFGITLSNRAGMMDEAEYIISKPKEPLKVACYYPHYTFFMDYLGDVLMCPHDWGKGLIAGNMNTEDFADIWTSSILMNARKKLAACNRNFASCKSCDVKGTLMGGSHAKAWEQYHHAAQTKADTE